MRKSLKQNAFLTSTWRFLKSDTVQQLKPGSFESSSADSIHINNPNQNFLFSDIKYSSHDRTIARSLLGIQTAQAYVHQELH